MSPIETQEHHLGRHVQAEIERLTSIADSLRTEVEALRAENARLKNEAGHLRIDVEILTKERDGFERAYAETARVFTAQNDTLRAEVERLTKELEQARYMVGLLDGNCDNGTCRACPACFDAVAARVQKLEVAATTLVNALHVSEGSRTPHSMRGVWCKSNVDQVALVHAVRAALESGTGPETLPELPHLCGECPIFGVCPKDPKFGRPRAEAVAELRELMGRVSAMPEAPAPKTFTVEEIEVALKATNWRCWHVEDKCMDSDHYKPCELHAFRRALGLGEQ